MLTGFGDLEPGMSLGRTRSGCTYRPGCPCNACCMAADAAEQAERDADALVGALVEQALAARPGVEIAPAEFDPTWPEVRFSASSPNGLRGLGETEIEAIEDLDAVEAEYEMMRAEGAAS